QPTRRQFSRLCQNHHVGRKPSGGGRSRRCRCSAARSSLSVTVFIDDFADLVTREAGSYDAQHTPGYRGAGQAAHGTRGVSCGPEQQTGCPGHFLAKWAALELLRDCLGDDQGQVVVTGCAVVGSRAIDTWATMSPLMSSCASPVPSLSITRNASPE